MKSPSYRITGFEANIIPDSSESNEFYTIKKWYKTPLPLHELHNYLGDFGEEVMHELMQFPYECNPSAIIIAKFQIIDISDGKLIFDCHERPVIEISYNESGDLMAKNLLLEES